MHRDDLDNKSLEECTIDELIMIATDCEDHDAILQVSAAGFNLEDGFWIGDYNGYRDITAPTLREALIKWISL